MYTIKENIFNKIEIKKSIFITCLYKVNLVTEVDDILNIVKSTYCGANHYCYAYIINDNIKSSDDCEPSGTAGGPILKVLENNNLNNVLCVVVRYFGGIKLGTGGLIRAYSKSAKEGLKNSVLVELINGFHINILIKYDDIKQIDYLLKNSIVINKTFLDNILYEAIVDDETFNKLTNYNTEIIEKILIEKDI